ncbi:hypothetical protein CDD80_369 [Ophiocordyceps camponoti-rufipedis]|uniref:Uncharacterized protein n=1 Tax=Ophiocordyceps camponoti-rufipedis TaxID=2004952 RepID=A0A2C5XYD1_9HYPO|nr:hypothetical protein CDD80_369 [Ophiocordyceps camponoti-rufipedis]
MLDDFPADILSIFIGERIFRLVCLGFKSGARNLSRPQVLLPPRTVRTASRLREFPFEPTLKRHLVRVHHLFAQRRMTGCNGVHTELCYNNRSHDNDGKHQILSRGLMLTPSQQPSGRPPTLRASNLASDCCWTSNVVTRLFNSPPDAAQSPSLRGRALGCRGCCDA